MKRALRLHVYIFSGPVAWIQSQGRIIHCAQCAHAHETPLHWRPHHQAEVKIDMLKFVTEVWLKCIETTTTKKWSSNFTCTLCRDRLIRPCPIHYPITYRRAPFWVCSAIWSHQPPGGLILSCTCCLQQLHIKGQVIGDRQGQGCVWV